MCKITFVRILVNLVVLTFLAGAGYLVYYVQQWSITLTRGTDYDGYHVLVQLCIQYMTTVTITVLNFFLPAVFGLLVRCEDYTPITELLVQLLR